jgi:hypothetical protein
MILTQIFEKTSISLLPDSHPHFQTFFESASAARIAQAFVFKNSNEF